jgi:hypothetical protein
LKEKEERERKRKRRGKRRKRKRKRKEGFVWNIRDRNPSFFSAPRKRRNILRIISSFPVTKHPSLSLSLSLSLILPE